MRLFASMFISIFLIISYTYCQNSTLPIVQVNFHIPDGWMQMNSTTYIIKDFDRTLNFWRKSFASGHQPWRLIPINAAAACLTEFGIKDKSSFLDLAARLREIEVGKVYSLKINKRKFFVYIKTENKTPIAYKLKIRKLF